MTTTNEQKLAPTGPLAGVRIVDMSTVVLGSFSTMIMGDLGAEVIKAEPEKRGDIMRYAEASPTGDLGPIYTNLNRNKRSIASEGKSDEGESALRVLLKDADVFFHNRYDREFFLTDDKKRYI